MDAGLAFDGVYRGWARVVGGRSRHREDGFGKIIKIKKSDTWKRIAEDNTKAIRYVFDNEFPKDDVKAILIHEQRGPCAYCMKRIRMDSRSRVEHFVPINADKRESD